MKKTWVMTPLVIVGVSIIIALFIYQNPQSVDTGNGTIFFAAILTASATILAITFSLSQYLVSRVGDLYSPYIISYYRDLPLTRITFISFVCTTIFSAILLGGNLEPLFFYQSLVWLTLVSFIFSIGFFARFFVMIITTVDPIEFATEIKIIANKYLEKNKKIDFQNVITSIGDTAIKSLERHEVRICSEYVDVLQHVALNYLDSVSRTKGEDDKDSESKESPAESEKLDENPLYLILTQFRRTYRIAYAKEESEISRQIITLSDKLMYRTLQGKGNDNLLRIFISSHPFDTFFHNIQKITSEDLRDRTEKKLLSQKLIFHVYPFSNPKNVQSEYLEHLVPKPLFDIVQIIIDKNDFFSFKYMTESSTYLWRKDPINIIEDMMTPILYSTTDPELHSFYSELESNLKIFGCWKFENLKKYMEMLDGFKKILLDKKLETDEEIDERVERMKKNVWDVYESSLIHLAFFWIGSYLLFRKKTEFLEQLWNVTTPEEDKTQYGNHPPISTSTTWICQFLRNSEFSSISSGPDFETYQSPVGFFFKYFGLILARSPSGFDFPSQITIKELVSNGQFDILKNWDGALSFLTTGGFVDFTKNLYEYIDINKFSKKEHSQLSVNQKIKDLQEKASSLIEYIEEEVPTIQEKISSFISKSLHEYESGTEMEKFANSAVVPNIAGKGYPLNVNYPLPKKPFTALEGNYYNVGLTVPEVMIEFERDVLTKSLIDSKPKSNRCKFDVLLEKLDSLYDEMTSDGFEPEYLVINRKLWAKILTELKIYGDLTIKSKKIPTVMSDQIGKDIILLVNKNGVKAEYESQNDRKAGLEVIENPDDAKILLARPSLRISVFVTEKKAVRRLSVTSIPT